MRLFIGPLVLVVVGTLAGCYVVVPDERATQGTGTPRPAPRPARELPPPPPPAPDPLPPALPPAAPPPSFVPEADLLRGGISIELTPAKRAFLPGENIPLRVALVNNNAEPAVLYEIRKAFMQFKATDAEGNTRPCKLQGRAPGRIRQDRFYSVAARSRTDKSVWLDGFCGDLGPGTWRIELEYQIPWAYNGHSFHIDAVTGAWHAMTTVEMVQPRPKANLTLHVTRPRASRTGQPLPIEVRLRNHGPESAFVLDPNRQGLVIEATNARGQALDCTTRTRRGRITRRDWVRLDRGRDIVVALDLDRRCTIPEAGRYKVTASFSVVEGDARVLGRRDAGRAWVGTVYSQTLPFHREAVVPRANITLSATAPGGTLFLGQSALVTVRANNLGPDTIALAAPNFVFVGVSYRDERGRPVSLKRAPLPQVDRADLISREVRPGSSIASHLDLGPDLERLGPGRWQAVLTYEVPAEPDTRVHGRWSELPRWAGRVTAAPVRLTVGRARPAITDHPHRPPPPPPPPSHVSEQPPFVWLTAPRQFFLGDTMDFQLHVAPSGRDDLVVTRPKPWMVKLTVKDRFGRTLRCSTPRAVRLPPRRTDFVTLRGKQDIQLPVSMLNRCGIRAPGHFYVTAQLRIPRTHDGGTLGFAGWSGTVVTRVLKMRVEPRRHH